MTGASPMRPSPSGHRAHAPARSLAGARPTGGSTRARGRGTLTCVKTQARLAWASHAFLVAASLAVVGGARPAPAAEAPAPGALEYRYESAVAAAQAGQYAISSEMFDDLLRRLPKEHPLRPLALYGAARSYEKLGTHEGDCEAFNRFRKLLGRTDVEADKRTVAERAVARLEAACAAPVTPSGAEGEMSADQRKVALAGVLIVLAGVLVTGLVMTTQ